MFSTLPGALIHVFLFEHDLTAHAVLHTLVTVLGLTERTLWLVLRAVVGQSGIAGDELITESYTDRAAGR